MDCKVVKYKEYVIKNLRQSSTNAPVESDVTTASVNDLDADSLSFVNVQRRSRKLAVYSQDVLCVAESCVWSVFHLRTHVARKIDRNMKHTQSKWVCT